MRSAWAAAAVAALIGARVVSAQAVQTAPDTPATVPASEPLRVMSLGRDHTAATAVWMATVHGFSQQADPAWVEASARAAGQLDPDWRVPWVYGSLMVMALGDHEGHRRLLEAAIEHHPSDPWFPTALALSHRLRGGDRDAALHWMRLAAQLPDAGPVVDAILARWEQP